VTTNSHPLLFTKASASFSEGKRKTPLSPESVSAAPTHPIMGSGVRGVSISGSTTHCRDKASPNWAADFAGQKMRTRIQDSGIRIQVSDGRLIANLFLFVFRF